MRYYICEDVNDEGVVYISTDDELEKGDLVVFMDYNQPCLARTVKEMPELEAITSEYSWFESLAHVSIKGYYEKRKAQLEKARLIKLMKEQMEIHALEEKLKKNAEINPEMSDLFNMYKTICESEGKRAGKSGSFLSQDIPQSIPLLWEKLGEKGNSFETRFVLISCIVKAKEETDMKDAFDILTEKLKSAGMQQIEIDHLLARFLQEEAFDYVDWIETELRNRKLEESQPKYLSGGALPELMVPALFLYNLM